MQNVKFAKILFVLHPKLEPPIYTFFYTKYYRTFCFKLEFLWVVCLLITKPQYKKEKIYKNLSIIVSGLPIMFVTMIWCVQCALYLSELRLSGTHLRKLLQKISIYIIT
jgi:hypothetical protein